MERLEAVTSRLEQHERRAQVRQMTSLCFGAGLSLEGTVEQTCIDATTETDKPHRDPNRTFQGTRQATSSQASASTAALAVCTIAARKQARPAHALLAGHLNVNPPKAKVIRYACCACITCALLSLKRPPLCRTAQPPLQPCQASRLLHRPIALHPPKVQ